MGRGREGYNVLVKRVGRGTPVLDRGGKMREGCHCPGWGGEGRGTDGGGVTPVLGKGKEWGTLLSPSSL